MNITLIGMPGSGKSFVGSVLAEALGFTVIDFDREMEKEYGGSSLQSLVEEWGDALFIEREADFAIRASEGKDKLIISPGGSIIYSPHAMEHLQDISRIVYLKAPLALIEKRINGIPRGIIGLGSKTLADLYAERVPLYEKYAHATFSADGDAVQIASAIVKPFA